MSDKTRMMADKALMRRRWEEQVARDLASPLRKIECQCGLSIHQTDIVTYQAEGAFQPVFYCRVCLPAQFAEMVRWT